MNTRNHLSEAADAIQRRIHTPEALDLIERAVARGDARELASGVVAAERRLCTSDEDAVERAMQDLEALANLSKPTGCALMACLWPLVDELYLHAESDSIDLWIWNCDSDKLTGYLKQIALSEKDADCRRHMEAIIKDRESKHGRG